MKPATIDHLVQNLRARDIAAFPVIHAEVQEDVAVVRARMNERDFSHMPIRNTNGDVVSVLIRNADAPILLDREKNVIPAEAPLATAITRLPDAGFLLVSSPESGYQDRISGIINHADILSLEVRLLIYTRTMQLERRVLDAIGQGWGDAPGLAHLWRKVDEKYRKGGERRSSREAYLGFSDVMLIAQVRQILPLSDEERERLCTARNFASHAAVDAPAKELSPEVITDEVEKCVRLVERLLLAGEH